MTRSRASRGANQAASSISGNDPSLPDLGGHSISKWLHAPNRRRSSPAPPRPPHVCLWIARSRPAPTARRAAQGSRALRRTPARHRPADPGPRPVRALPWGSTTCRFPVVGTRAGLRGGRAGLVDPRHRQSGTGGGLRSVSTRAPSWAIPRRPIPASELPIAVRSGPPAASCQVGFDRCRRMAVDTFTHLSRPSHSRRSQPGLPMDPGLGAAVSSRREERQGNVGGNVAKARTIRGRCSSRRRHLNGWSPVGLVGTAEMTGRRWRRCGGTPRPSSPLVCIIRSGMDGARLATPEPVSRRHP